MDTKVKLAVKRFSLFVARSMILILTLLDLWYQSPF